MKFRSPLKTYQNRKIVPYILEAVALADEPYHQHFLKEILKENGPENGPKNRFSKNRGFHFLKPTELKNDARSMKIKALGDLGGVCEACKRTRPNFVKKILKFTFLKQNLHFCYIFIGFGYIWHVLKEISLWWSLEEPCQLFGASIDFQNFLRWSLGHP